MNFFKRDTNTYKRYWHVQNVKTRQSPNARKRQPLRILSLWKWETSNQSLLHNSELRVFPDSLAHRPSTTGPPPSFLSPRRVRVRFREWEERGWKQRSGWCEDEAMSQAVKCKEIAHPRKPSETMQPCQHFDFGTSDLQGCTIITSCCLHFVVICYSSNRKLMQTHQLLKGKHQQSLHQSSFNPLPQNQCLAIFTNPGLAPWSLSTPNWPLPASLKEPL